jgi:hypothetical protein
MRRVRVRVSPFVQADVNSTGIAALVTGYKTERLRLTASAGRDVFESIASERRRDVMQAGCRGIPFFGCLIES